VRLQRGDEGSDAGLLGGPQYVLSCRFVPGRRQEGRAQGARRKHLCLDLCRRSVSRCARQVAAELVFRDAIRDIIFDFAVKYEDMQFDQITVDRASDVPDDAIVGFWWRGDEYYIMRVEKYSAPPDTLHLRGFTTDLLDTLLKRRLNTMSLPITLSKT